MAAEKDSRSPREKQADYIEGLQAKHGLLAQELVEAPDRQHEARVRAQTANPGRSSTEKGAASEVFKIEESTRLLERKLSEVERELDAAKVVLKQMDDLAAVEAHAARVRLNAGLRKKERFSVDALKGISADLQTEFAVYRRIVDERTDAFGGAALSDPELAGAIPEMGTVVDLLMFLEREAHPELVEPPGTFPAAAGPKAVVPTRKGDPRWAARSSVTR